MSRKRADYDNPWKEILERLFEWFIAFFYPELYKLINWSRGHEFLDSEFQRLIENDRLSHNRVDKLVKVWLKTGGVQWILVHIEMQAKKEKGFAERIFYYLSLMYAHHRRPVVSIAILGDDDPSWKPDFFGYNIPGLDLHYRYPCVKILDYRSQWDMLEKSLNPFSLVVMAYLKMLETKKDVTNRFVWKFTIAKSLLERGFNKDEISALFRFMDILMSLPAELEEDFRCKVVMYQKEKNMPEMMIPWEKAAFKDGMEKGMEKGVLYNSHEAVINVLEARFDSVPRTLVSSIRKLDNVVLLKSLLKIAVKVSSLEEFKKSLNEGKL